MALAILGPEFERIFNFCLVRIVEQGHLCGTFLWEKWFGCGSIAERGPQTVEKGTFNCWSCSRTLEKKDSVKEMQRWISALTPVEQQKYQSGLTSQNLNKACNDLLKKSQKLGKNKKKEELELLRQSLFYLPGWNARMARKQLTPK